MARRRYTEEPVNHERWLVSYADFITLLFAFFVVMYSISSINEGKYKVISEALIGVFTDADRALKPIPIGDERPQTVTPAKPWSRTASSSTLALPRPLTTRSSASPMTSARPSATCSVPTR